ncbi:unnamed protein product [Lymnaea stagnalis]|uniref:Uncharacterized protein n=1 Tax=Lymnaea stagnalis TaxID=6523 RepID=A0AAV2IMA5_LYMST
MGEWCGCGGNGVDVEGMVWVWREWCGCGGNGVGVEGMVWVWREWCGCGGNVKRKKKKQAYVEKGGGGGEGFESDLTMWGNSIVCGCSFRVGWGVEAHNSAVENGDIR